MLSTIEMIRMGDSTNGELLGRVSHLLVTLQLYHTSFEVAFLQDSIRFFTLEGNLLINQVETAKFLFHVDKRIYESVEMTSRFLDSSTRKPLLEILDNHLLKPHANTLLEKGFKLLMDENRKEDLKRMFFLFERVKLLDLLKAGWSMYIRQIGESFMGNISQQKNFVEDVLAFQERLDSILRQCFQNQDLFKQALKSSFEHFLNLNQKVAAEQVARYVDQKMRGQVRETVNCCYRGLD
jgi:hypothetical protein